MSQIIKTICDLDDEADEVEADQFTIGINGQAWDIDLCTTHQQVIEQLRSVLTEHGRAVKLDRAARANLRGSLAKSTKIVPAIAASRDMIEAPKPIKTGPKPGNILKETLGLDIATLLDEDGVYHCPACEKTSKKAQGISSHIRIHSPEQITEALAKAS